MERITHLILLLSGLCSLSSCVPPYNYVLFNTPQTWYDAQRYCRQSCVDLVTISNMGEMEKVLTAVEGKYDDAAWIGLHKGASPLWYWSLSGYGFYVQDPFFQMYFYPPISTDCASYNMGYLYTRPCSSALYSICFDATKQGQDQYILTTSTMGWITAHEYCRTNYTELACIRNYAEYQIISQLANGQLVWIGFFADDWVWSDQTYPAFRYWPADQYVWRAPLAECGALMKNKSGRWGARPCLEKHPYICKCGTKLTFIKMKISSYSVLDLNKPAVQNNILNKVSLTLLSRNVTDAFQLQWRKQPDGNVFIKETPLDD